MIGYIISLKLNLNKFLKKENISRFFFISVSLYFFIFFEIVLYSVFSRFPFLDFIYLLCWQIAAFSIYIIIFFSGIKSKKFRIFYFSFIAFISGIAFIVLNQLKSLDFLKTYAIVFFIIAIVGNYFSITYFSKKTKSKKKNKKKLINKTNITRKRIKILLIFIVLISLLSSVFFLIYPRNEVIIKPKTEPELIFWTDPYFLPDDDYTYKICKKYNIAFMPAVGSHTFNKSSLMERYKLAISNGVNLYFSLITPPDAFINMDNTNEYLPLYQDYRQWFIDENIFDSQYVKAFVVDAEPPSRYTEKVREETLVDSTNYFLDEYPSKNEVKDATRNVRDLIDEIRKDGKEAGIIRISSYMDDLDDDGDIELYLRNIYSLDVIWDFSITMLYRVGRIIAESGDSTDVVVNNMKKNVLGQITEDVEDLNVLSAYNFYFRVGLCQKSSGGITAEKHHIFIGTLKNVFNNTDYMKDKEYLDDLDICRHFNQEKVFLYNYKNFINNYGIKELINLGEHNQKKKSWKLEYQGTDVQINVVYYLALAFLDRLLYLENS